MSVVNVKRPPQRTAGTGVFVGETAGRLQRTTRRPAQLALARSPAPCERASHNALPVRRLLLRRSGLGLVDEIERAERDVHGAVVMCKATGHPRLIEFY